MSSGFELVLPKRDDEDGGGLPAGVKLKDGTCLLGCGVVAPPPGVALDWNRPVLGGFEADGAPLPKRLGLFCSPPVEAGVLLPKPNDGVALLPKSEPVPPLPAAPPLVLGPSPGVPADALPNIPVAGAAELVGAGLAGFCWGKEKLLGAPVLPDPWENKLGVLPKAPPCAGLFCAPLAGVAPNATGAPAVVDAGAALPKSGLDGSAPLLGAPKTKPLDDVGVFAPLPTVPLPKIDLVWVPSPPALPNRLPEPPPLEAAWPKSNLGFSPAISR